MTASEKMTGFAEFSVFFLSSDCHNILYCYHFFSCDLEIRPETIWSLLTFPIFSTSIVPIKSDS